MASRAPTLAKPKAKSKVTTKKIVAKSSTAQTSVALKSVPKTSAKAVTKTTTKTPTKPSVAKTVSAAKSAAAKTVVSSKVAVAHDAHKSLPKSKVAAVVNEAPAKLGNASFEAPAPKPRRRTKGEVRTRIYWAVFNQALRRVAVFEFDQREEAEKRAAKLALSTGEHHFLQKIKALVQQ